MEDLTECNFCKVILWNRELENQRLWFHWNANDAQKRC